MKLNDRVIIGDAPGLIDCWEGCITEYDANYRMYKVVLDEQFIRVAGAGYTWCFEDELTVIGD